MVKFEVKSMVSKDEINKPKILIHDSEHPKIESNQLLRFAEGNQLINDLNTAALNRNGKELGYKISCSVLIPSPDSEKIDVIPINHFDIGNTLFNSPYKQLWYLNELDEKQNAMLLNDMAFYTHERLNGQNTIKENSMLIHDGMTEFREFGLVNEADYDEFESPIIRYTVAIVQDTGDVKAFSGEYNLGDYAFPLHHIDKNELIDKEIYDKLAESWQTEVTRKEEQFFEINAPLLVKKLHELERG